MDNPSITGFDSQTLIVCLAIRAIIGINQQLVSMFPKIEQELEMFGEITSMEEIFR